MARPLRIKFSGALYHVTSRGHAQENIHRDDTDMSQYYTVLAEVCGRSNCIIHAYCLMDNHYHLLVETPEHKKNRIYWSWLVISFSIPLGSGW